MNTNKAGASLLLAALVPGTVALLMGATKLTSVGEAFLGFVLWYAFSLPMVVCVGVPTLIVALKVKSKWGGLLIPPIVGFSGGMLIAKLSYAQEVPAEAYEQFSIAGLTTAIVACLVYFGKEYGRENNHERK